MIRPSRSTRSPEVRALALRSLLALALLLLATGTRAAEEIAGRVLLGLGTPIAVDAEGNERALGRGVEVRQGDTLRTGAGDRLQVRFTDGARLAMRPDSEISVDEYSFAETAPPAQTRVTMSLTRGGFRTITGAIAERNRRAYRVQTPFAVIGVRGTDWSAVIDDLGDGDNLILGVNEGGIFAENDGGAIDLGDDADFDFAVVRSFTDAPEGLQSMPAELDSTLQLPMPAADDDPAGTGDGQSAAGAGDPEIVIGAPGDQDGAEGDGDGQVMFLTAEDGDDDTPVFEISQRCL